MVLKQPKNREGEGQMGGSKGRTRGNKECKDGKEKKVEKESNKRKNLEAKPK